LIDLEPTNLQRFFPAFHGQNSGAGQDVTGEAFLNEFHQPLKSLDVGPGKTLPLQL